MTRPPPWHEPMSRKRILSLPCAQAEPAAGPSEDIISEARPKRSMAPSCLRLKTQLCGRRTWSLDQALRDHPCLDHIGDLGIVLVLHQHVRISPYAHVRQA